MSQKLVRFDAFEFGTNHFTILNKVMICFGQWNQAANSTSAKIIFPKAYAKIPFTIASPYFLNEKRVTVACTSSTVSANFYAYS